MSRPKVVTVSSGEVPKRHWELPVALVSTMAEVPGSDVCQLCCKPVRDHTWYVVNPETDYVSDCSEMPL